MSQKAHTELDARISRARARVNELERSLPSTRVEKTLHGCVAVSGALTAWVNGKRVAKMQARLFVAEGRSTAYSGSNRTESSSTPASKVPRPPAIPRTARRALYQPLGVLLRKGEHLPLDQRTLFPVSGGDDRHCRRAYSRDPRRRRRPGVLTPLR
jgi:hypothetical protein